MIVALLLGSILCARAQTPVPEPDESAARKPHRIHLILKDGSFQIVTSYTVSGKVVRYVSAERGGAQEEIPTELVDLAATERWEKQHTTPAAGEAGRPSALDPELLKEEQERAALTPEVEPDLRLPEQDTLLALDYFQGTPQLVPMMQSEGDLNRTTSHSIVKRAINPRAAAQQLVTLRGVKSYVQLHVETPVLYLRIGDDVPASGGEPLVVDTHGSSSAKVNDTPNASASRYVVVQADVRTDARVLSTFSGTRLTEDVVETKNEVLPGGHWMKLTPSRPLLFGEYAVVEILSDKEINLAVWDFGVHPTAPENRDVIKPESKKRLNLERRRPN